MQMSELLSWLSDRGVVISAKQVRCVMAANGRRPALVDPPPIRNAAAHYVFGLREAFALKEHFEGKGK